ncbi:MAG: hypothetical protein IAE97_02930 [Chthoniobacterales bacterium]|nr:hypothetical protein [Chthoniobacterales bacterium]
MPSPRIPRMALALLAVAMASVIAGATYGIWWNPDLGFWKEMARRKFAWVEKLHGKHDRAIGVVGGSTTLFAIDAGMLEEKYGLPVANLGMAASLGPDVCAGFGFSALRRGDFLIVSLEPAMLTDQTAPTASGTQLAIALGRPELLTWGNGPGLFLRLVNPATILPGGYHVVTLLGKLALGQRLSRYKLEDSRPGGFLITNERQPFAEALKSGGTGPLQLSADGRTLLERMRTEADARGIQIAYVLPWAFCPEPAAAARRAAYRPLLHQIGQIMPVLDEPQLGVHTVLADFSDSAQHLTEEAARHRSEVFAETLRMHLDANPAH